MTKKSLWMMAVGALAFAACGEGGSSEQVGGGDETGGLSVNVLDITEAQIAFVRLDLAAQGTANNRAVPKVIDLERGQAGTTVGVAPGVPAKWTYLDSDVPVGDYAITAKAYTLLPGDAGFDPANFAFESPVANVTVVSGNTATANIFLRQNPEDPDFNTPYFDTVVFDRQPAYYQTTKITVTGSEGANGTLDLDAQGAGTFNTVSGATWVPGTGDAKAASATIDWMPKDPTTPGTAENQIVTLRLKDSAGNDTSLKMTINVDHERGDIDFNITFNEAPSIDVETSIVNELVSSKDLNVVTMTATYDDPEYDDPANKYNVNYTWDVSDCVGVGVVVLPGPNGSNEVTGAVEGDGVEANVVTLTWDYNAGTPPTRATCFVEIKVEDQGISDGSGGWEPGSASSRTKKINLTVGTVAPSVVPNP